MLEAPPQLYRVAGMMRHPRTARAVLAPTSSCLRPSRRIFPALPSNAGVAAAPLVLVTTMTSAARMAVHRIDAMLCCDQNLHRPASLSFDCHQLSSGPYVVNVLPSNHVMEHRYSSRCAAGVPTSCRHAERGLVHESCKCSLKRCVCTAWQRDSTCLLGEAVT